MSQLSVSAGGAGLAAAALRFSASLEILGTEHLNFSEKWNSFSSFSLGNCGKSGFFVCHQFSIGNGMAICGGKPS
jgi:hypothetical protein